MNRGIPCSILRGGTSKGLFFLRSDLPLEEKEVESALLRLMGSPDKKQIDGLGGAVSTASKVAILAPSDRPDADVLYTFAQVSVDKPFVSWAGNCGNISSAVGPFAIESGLVKAADGVTTVRIYNVNTGKVIAADVQTPGGSVQYDGDCVIPGVPGSAAPVRLSFLDPAGSAGQGLLPTGNARDTLDVGGVGRIEVSIVDATNPLCFVRAADVGMTGRELPSDIDKNGELLTALERIRGACALRMNLISDISLSASVSPGIPKMTVVSPPQDYTTPDGGNVSGRDIDVTVRMMSMQKAHPTCAMTGAMCIVTAAALSGSVVYDLRRPGADFRDFRIGHPAGVISAGVETREEGGKTRILSVSGIRTARLMMSGTAYL